MSNLKRSIFTSLAVLLIGAGFALLILSSGLSGCNKSLQTPNLDTFEVTNQGLPLEESGALPADGVSPDTIRLRVADSVTEYYDLATFTVSSAVFTNGSTSMRVPLVADSTITLYVVSQTVGSATVTCTVGGTSVSVHPTFTIAPPTAILVSIDSTVLPEVDGASTLVTAKLIRPDLGIPTPGQQVMFSWVVASGSNLAGAFSTTTALSDSTGKAVTHFSLSDAGGPGTITITASVNASAVPAASDNVYVK